MVLALLTLGCSCGQPALPQDTDPATLPTRPPPPTEDTGDDPQCAFEEEEPNNSAEMANDLPLEAQACGQFNTIAGDSDNWSFEVTHATWIGIDVEAQRRGSLANPAVAVVGAGTAFNRTDDEDSGDVGMLVPLTPSTYTLQVFEQNFSGADDGRWFYDLQVSEQKAPRSWNGVIDEPADGPTDARVVQNGDVLYGVIDDTTDEDWLRIDIPPGRHVLTVSTEAYASGSPLDALIELEDDTGEPPACPSTPSCRFERGITGFENDPFARYTSEGDETIYIRFRDESSGGSPFHWYILDVSLESAD